MALPIYLAMTAFELQHCERLPEKCGWMACHFSPYSSGLTNIPVSLPENALLIVNDRTPPMRHNNQTILLQLQQAIERLCVYGVLLDFQMPFQEDMASLGNALRASLPCPVGITPQYAKNWDGPVFLPPVPPYCPVAEHLSPWHGQEIWLDCDNDCADLIISENGCQIVPTHCDAEGLQFADQNLFCHYTIKLGTDSATFTLGRTKEDSIQLLDASKKLGVTLAVGLYQQFGA